MRLRCHTSAVTKYFRAMTCYRSPISLALLLCFCVSRIGAQGSSATINGQITDPAGRVVPGTEIQIVNIDTNAVYPSKSNGSGIYYVSGLIPGRYRLMVRKDGFKVVNKTDITLHVQDILEQNVALEIGSNSESITVDGSGVNINTTDGSVSTVIDRKFVANMPLNGRSFQDLISMTPGISTQSPQTSQGLGYSGDFSVNGQRTESNYYTVDGVAANVGAGNGYGGAQPANGGSIAAASALGTTQSLLSVDALQEFRVNSSTYSAEYGRSPGGQFSFLSRSGSNQPHGSIYDYFRNDFFDANDWFNDDFGVLKPALRQNDFGVTFDSRLVIPYVYDGRDRSFFFASYEGLRLIQPQAAQIQYVPDDALRSSAPAALKPFLMAFPQPTPGGIDYGSLAQFVKSYSLPSQIDSGSLRIDQQITPKTSIFFRFGDTPSVSASRYLSNVTEVHLDSQTYTLGMTSQLTTSIVNDFHLGYSRSNSTQSTTLDSFGGATPTNLANPSGLAAYAGAAATFEMFIPGVGLTDVNTNETGNKMRQWNETDVMSLAHGKHQFKVGLDFRQIKSPLKPANVEGVGIYESSASVVNNSADVLVLAKSLPASPIFNEFAVFAQDEWRLTSSVNLSVGIRWELNPPPTEANGNEPYTLLGNVGNPATLTLAPRGTSLWNTSHYNFAPRLGVAWKANGKQNWETVVRTGGGVFFDTDNEFAALGFSGLGFSAENVLFGAAFPLTAAELNFSPTAAAPYTSETVFAFPRNLQLPYTLQWNVALQQQLGSKQTITVSYVASNGRRLLQEQTQSISAFNPNFDSIAYLVGGVTSNYQSLQLQFQRSISHGVQALASYTWAHAIDYGSNYSSITLTRGNSDFDLRHNLQGGISWDLPGFRNENLLSGLLNGWGIDGRLLLRTGFPITIYGNYLTDPSTGRNYYTNADLVPNMPVYLYGSKFPGGRSLNPAAFTYPVGTDTGDAPRNRFRGFGEGQVNMAVRRDFNVLKDLRLQFRAEAFNVLNHPNFGMVDSSLGDATFGQATQMLNQSLGTVASQYQQGGPRSMQFALKVIF